MDENEILERILKRPESVRSLLGNKYGRNSITVYVKRKISRNIKSGLLRRVLLNGSRGGESLYIHRDKKYQIIIIAEHRNFRYFVCDKLCEKNNAFVCLKNPMELIPDKGWIMLDNDSEIFKSNVIKVI